MINYIMIFVIGVIVGIILMAIAVASDERWGYRDENEDENDLISRSGLIEYLNLDSYDDTDGIKVKYIRAYLNKKEE